MRACFIAVAALAVLFAAVATAEVVVLTSDTYPTVTSDAAKVVLVKTYATWCGHCTALAPDYIEVAKHFEGNDKVVVAKFDAPANEDYARNVLKLRSFPTIFLYKNGQRLDYSGARNKQGLIEFVNANL